MSGAGFMQNYVNNRSKLEQFAAQNRSRRIQRLKQDAAQERSEIDLLHDDVSELKLALACLLNLMVKREIVKAEDLLNCAEAIDPLDGKTDGMFHGKIEPDGTLTPDVERPHGALDDLANAARQKKRDDK